jgi:RimJ/RimL family protein N-acetyltransferase
VLVFAVVIDGRAVGTQEMTASEFPRLRTVNTFSWLTRSYQGRGFGKEMRRAILHLAFDGLGTARAESEAFEDNPASLGVSDALGYRRNGTVWTLRQDEAAPMVRFFMTFDDAPVEKTSPSKA